MIPIPRAGRMQVAHGLDRARAEPGVWAVEITAKPGTHIAPPPDGDRYAGFVFARAADRADVVATLRRAASHIELEIA